MGPNTRLASEKAMCQDVFFGKTAVKSARLQRLRNSLGLFTCVSALCAVSLAAVWASPKDLPGTNGVPGAATEFANGDGSRAAAPLSAEEADEDFRARCHAAGVIKCVGWDDPLDFMPPRDRGGYADGLYPASDGTYQGLMDPTIKTSGAGSLRFVIRPHVTSNWTGFWRANFGTQPKVRRFGPHSTLYLQFRLRLDAKLLSFKWNTVSDTGWKVFIAYGPIPGPSCTGAQFVQENTYQTNIATAYTSCGTPSLETNNGVPPKLVEQGDYNCWYRHQGSYAKDSSCFAYPADTWMTEYWIVEIGDYGEPNTHFTAYIAPQGKPLKRFIDLPNFRFNKGGDEEDALMSILLQPYMGGADGSKDSPATSMWFDELIISTQPIAAPKY